MRIWATWRADNNKKCGLGPATVDTLFTNADPHTQICGLAEPRMMHNSANECTHNQTVLCGNAQIMNMFAIVHKIARKTLGAT